MRYSSKEQLPNSLTAATGNPHTLTALYEVLKIPIFSDTDGTDTNLEPHIPEDAVLWKLDQVPPQKDAYAADVGFEFVDTGERTVKPSRFKDLSQADTEENAQQFFSTTRPVKWTTSFAQRNVEGMVSMISLEISATVPPLTIDEIREYSSPHSSAGGLLLVKLLEDRYPDTKYVCKDKKSGRSIAITPDIAWKLIVEKVPPRELLAQLWSTEEIERQRSSESEIGVISVGWLSLMTTHREVSIQHELKNGEKVEIILFHPGLAESVRDLLYDNFDNSESYASLSQDARLSYKRANTQERIIEDAENEKTVLSLVARSEQGRVTGYILVSNGDSKAKNGEVAAVIKRMHTSRDSVGNGLGSEIIALTSEYVKSCGIDNLAVGASGSSRTFFERNGFIAVESGNNPILSQRGVCAPWVYLEKEL